MEQDLEYLNAEEVNKNKLLLIAKEENVDDSFSSFDFLPFTFLGLKTSSFGNTLNNPFYKIRDIAIDTNKTFEDRCEAVRYMQRIPHVNRKETINSMLSILKHILFSFIKRYYFMSNNDRIIKLDYDLVNTGHKCVYDDFDSLNAPLHYKINSSQHILTQLRLEDYDKDEVQSFLLNIGKDTNKSLNLRAEACDILSRCAWDIPIKEEAKKIIEELGEDISVLRTIYTNSQNVHNEHITDSFLQTLRSLKSDTLITHNIDEINGLLKLEIHSNNYDKLSNVFQQILINTARYDDLTLTEILLLIYERICDHPSHEELKKRLIEEMCDMDGTCSTGYLSRLLNVLSGFYDNVAPVRISYKDQLRSNIFARFTFYISTLNEHNKNSIVEEISKGDNDKDLIMEFLSMYDVHEELYDEFKPYVTDKDYNDIYTRCKNDYFGFETKREL